MTPRSSLLLAAFVALSALADVRAQYPQILPEVGTEAATHNAGASRRSKEAFAKAMPAVEAWAAKGKPFIPGAAKPTDLPQADLPSFPGAQGGGMYTFGGRGGRVFVVTNLDDSGPGSFREACEAGGPRIVVFNVAGIIRLKERLSIRSPYITISGATAPGDGVCLAGESVELDTHDVIIRHMRFRRGATWVGDRNDSLGGNPTGNIMIDHVSASWGLDENMSMYRHMYRSPEGGDALKLPTVNITIQNSIFSEALNTFNHAFGSTIGGYNSTFHHNLWACNTGRNPSVGMIYDFTFTNNVLFNWRHRTIDGGDHRSFYTIENNYFKPGPATPANETGYRLLKPEARRIKPPVDEFGQAYVAGNVVEGNERVTRDNWDGGVQPETIGPRAEILSKIRQNAPYPHAYLEIESAAQAYQTVLRNAGATLPRRDAVDLRVLEMVRTGKVPKYDAASVRSDIGDVGYEESTIASITEMVSQGIITNPTQVGGYPDYRGQPYPDADKDGMPDAWESAHGLNPNDAADASSDLNGDGYTNIEDFINGLDPRAPKQTWPTPRTYRDLWGNLSEKP